MRRKTGQSILEYIIVLTAVIGGVVLAVSTFAPHDASTGLGMFYTKAGETLENATGNIAAVE
jgi:hypothetical protein